MAISHHRCHHATDQPSHETSNCCKRWYSIRARKTYATATTAPNRRRRRREQCQGRRHHYHHESRSQRQPAATTVKRTRTTTQWSLGRHRQSHRHEQGLPHRHRRVQGLPHRHRHHAARKRALLHEGEPSELWPAQYTCMSSGCTNDTKPSDAARASERQHKQLFV